MSHLAIVCVHKKMSLKFCTIRSRPRKFGITFTIPGRITSEINDKKRIKGKHPLRITRIPLGGPREFHNLVQEAEKGSSSLLNLKKKNGFGNKLLSHKRAYHRNRFNDWYVEVFYFESFEAESEKQSFENNL